VEHPRDWAWVGFNEIMGSRKRYRVIDLERLCWHLRADNVEEVRKNLIASLAERIARDEVKREPCWTESLAVGSLGFVEKVKPLILFRRKTEMVSTAGDVWVLQEAVIPYGQKTGVKNASNLHSAARKRGFARFSPLALTRIDPLMLMKTDPPGPGKRHLKSADPLWCLDA